jgi:acetylornithine deacetylase
VVGEPTENRLALGHKGALGARVKVTGRACHSAYPEEGDSAIHRLLGYLQTVLEADFGDSELLGPATVNVGGIEGGVAHNVLAPDASAEIMIRVVSDLAGVESRLQECFIDPSTGALDEKVELDVTLRMESPEFEKLEGFEETVVFYGTDAPFLRDVGKLVLFGPGSIVDAHTADEKISKAAMDEGVESYVRMGRLLIR